MRYKHIVFDLDGTLIDTERAILPSLRDTLEELTGRHYEEQALTFALGITGADALERLGIARYSYRFYHYGMRKCTGMKILSPCSAGGGSIDKIVEAGTWYWASSRPKPGKNLLMILADLALAVIFKP